MLCEKTFYELSLLSYFDTYAVNIPVSDMIRHIQEDEQLMQDYGQYPDFQNNMKLVRQINPDEYAHMTVKEWYNDNADSGVVYYTFEMEDALIFAFRGSEKLDDVHHKTGWQDWKDNFRMFLKDPTWQQILTLHQIQKTDIQKPFYMCGHSKGGNLSLYVALTMKKELQDYLVKVVSFNAPGITKPILSLYEQRAKDPEFLEKLLIFENENDCVSAFFENLKEPVYVRSCYPCTNMEELYHNHNLYAMDFRDNAYVMAEKKTVMPKFFYHFINDFFMNLKEERVQRVVAKMDEYFDSGCSMEELYKLMLVDVSRYVSLFEDIPEEEMATITLQDLIDRRKTKLIMDKVKELQPNKTLQKMADTVRNSSPVAKLNEIDMKEITQGLIDNYELMVKEKTKEFQAMITENNEKIMHAIRSIRNREGDSQERI